MTCTDCIYVDVCEEWHNQEMQRACYYGEYFKNKTDFVEVIRCKDCLSYHPSPRSKVTVDSGYCDICENFVTAEHYCASGERKGVK
jgi:hypothetical protein